MPAPVVAGFLQWAEIQSMRSGENVHVDGILTTAVSANGPEVTSSGSDIARAQCRVADSQSCAFIADSNAARDDYRS